MASKKNFELLSKLENAFISEDIEACKKQLAFLLRSIEIEEEESHAFTFSFITHFYSRLAFIIQHIFLHPGFGLTIQEYGQWIAYHNRLSYILFLSGLRGNNQLVHLMRGRISSTSGLQLDNPQKLLPYLLLLNPSSAQASEDLLTIFGKYPRLAYPILINFLTFRGYTIPAVYDRQKKVSATFLQADPDNLPPSLYSNLHHMWAISSYQEGDYNESIKRKINEILINDLQAKGIQQEPKISNLTLPLQGSKPKLLVMAEHMNPEHVMYDCFGTSLAELRSYFEVIAYTADSDKGTAEWDWVDRLLTFNVQNFAFNIEVDRLQKLQPDVVLYPSIGMKMWALMFSRIRLAPLQIALLGHPDLPHSPVIDHLIGGHLLLEKTADQEKLISLPNTSGSLFGMVNRRKLARPATKPENSPLRVAVVANVYKMNATFASVLRKIRQEAPEYVEFHIYQNLRGLHFHLSKTQIQEVVSDDRIIFHPALKARTYYNSLAQNDLMLSPFPFGGENSTLDALLCGVPVLALFGKEPRERLDYRVLTIAGLTDQLVVATPEEYVLRTLDWLQNPEKLRALQSAIDPDRVLELFEKEREASRGELAETIHDLYRKTVD
jgi:predicted O-linked N-acetylglucosamine transferase (SPINDLY family)